MQKFIFATKNKGKLKEIQSIMSGFEIISMEDAGIHIDIIENGETFEENALKKATEIMNISGSIVLADDSGLEIDYLQKMPGVHSARYLGYDTPYTVKNSKILEMLAGVSEENRTARFVSVIAAAFPDGKTLTGRGIIEGTIAYEAKGENGFGYDPIFFVKEYNMTMAEMPLELKNSISHRGIALRNMKNKLVEAYSE